MNLSPSLFLLILNTIFINLVNALCGSGTCKQGANCVNLDCGDGARIGRLSSDSTCQGIGVTSIEECCNGSQVCLDVNSSYCRVPQQLNTQQYICRRPDGICENLDLQFSSYPSSYIGVDSNNQCLSNGQTSYVQQCSFNLNQVCMMPDRSQCILYLSNPNILGVDYNGKCLIQDKTDGQYSTPYFMKEGYCMTQQYVPINLYSQSQYAGIKGNYMCALPYEGYSIRECNYGYCSYQDACYQLTDRPYVYATDSNGDPYSYPIMFYSKLNVAMKSACSYLNVAVAVECNYTIYQVCYKTSASYCTQINDTDPTQAGYIEVGGVNKYICIERGQQVSKVSLCATEHCIEKSGSTESCVYLDGDDNRMSKAPDQYCEGTNYPFPSICARGRICKDTNDQYKCKRLSNQINLKRVGRELYSSYCLPFTSYNAIGTLISNCADDFCIYTKTTQYQYCIQLGSSVYGKVQAGLLKSSEMCAVLNTPISGVDSIGCAKDFYCIDMTMGSPTNKQCVNMNSSSNPLVVGRELSTDYCIPDTQKIAILCKKGYCILNNQCIPLSRKYPGRENGTSSCLVAEATGQKGASDCFFEFCIDQPYPSKPQFNSCVELDYVNPKRVGARYPDQVCIGVGIPTAMYCFKGQFCLRGTVCEEVLDINCSNSSNNCVTQSTNPSNPNCYKCNFNQCLDMQGATSGPGICQDMNGKFCQDSSGYCQILTSKMCKVCPYGYCLIEEAGICLSSSEMEGYVTLTQCIYIRRKDRKCISYELDIPLDGVMQCRDPQNKCIELENSLECLICPSAYTNPSSKQCYSPLEKQQIYVKAIREGSSNSNVQGISLIYVKLGCYDNNNCITDATKQCGGGCYECESQDKCIQCIEGYFLTRASPLVDINFCSPCPNTFIPLDYSFINYFNYQTQYKQYLPPQDLIVKYNCLSCSLNTGDWALPDLMDKTCLDQIIRYADIHAISFNNAEGKAMKFQNLVLTNTCPTNCDSCGFQDGKDYCFKCLSGFTLNDKNECVQCPQNCLECDFAVSQSKSLLLIGDIPKSLLDSGEIQLTDLKLVCLVCAQYYTYSPDLSQCEPCGVDCNKCVYGQKNILYNTDKQNLNKYSTQFYKDNHIVLQCLECFDGKVISFNGSDCQQKIANCEVHSLYTNTIQKFSLIDKWSYLLDTTGITTQSCLKCIPGYVLSSNFLTCTQGCLLDGCESCKKDPSEYIRCQTCDKKIPLDSESNKCLIRTDTIYNNRSYQEVPNCLQSYNYLDTSTNQIISQCVNCSTGIPSIFGCIQCPEGCKTCYEGSRDFNYTSYLLYQRDKISLQDRLNYKSNGIGFKCTSCSTGYTQNYSQESCIASKCGNECETCLQIGGEKKPKCVTCNENLLASQISSLSYYIANFYFLSNEIPQISSMISFNEDQTNCQICPMACQLCTNDYDIKEDPLNLYMAKCYSCKHTKPDQDPTADDFFKQPLKDIFFDRERLKCYYCNSTDVGCYYKKKRIIYSECLSLQSNIGKGKESDPLNYNRISEIDFDAIILNDEADAFAAIVQYNEYQVREMEIIIHLNTQTCTEIVPNIIKSTMTKKVKSLEKYRLIFQGIDSEKFTTLYQKGVITIDGFNEVVVQNINFLPKYEIEQIGFYITFNDLKNVTFQNVIINRNEKLQNSNKLILEFNNLSKYLTFENVTINNYYFVDNLSLIKVTPISNHTLLYGGLIELNFTQFSLVNISMINSGLLNQIAVNKIDLNINDYKILDVLMDKSSYLFEFNNVQPDLSSNLKLSKLFINNSYILNKSYLMNGNIFKIKEIQNLTLSNNTLSSDELSCLIQINSINLYAFKIEKNNITNTCIFQKKNLKEQSYQLQKDQIISGQIVNNTNLNTTTLLYYSDSLQRSDLYLQNIQISDNIFVNDSQKVITFIQQGYLRSLTVKNIDILDFERSLFISAENLYHVRLDMINLRQNQFVPSINNSQSSNLTSYGFMHLNSILLSAYISNVYANNIQLRSSLFSLTYNYFNSRVFNSDEDLEILLDKQQIFISNIFINNLDIVLYDKSQQISPIQIQSKSFNKITLKNINIQRSMISSQNKQFYNLYSNGLVISHNLGDVDLIDLKFQENFSNDSYNTIIVTCLQLRVIQSSFEGGDLIPEGTIKGGFIFVYSKYLYIDSCSFKKGYAIKGGAIYWGVKSIGFADIYNTIFDSNVAQSQIDFESYGGCLYLDGYESFGYDINIRESSFTNSTSNNKGGVLYILPFGYKVNLIIKNTFIQNSFSLQGSIIFIYQIYNLNNYVSIVDSEILQEQEQLITQIKKVHKAIEEVNLTTKISLLENNLFHIFGARQIEFKNTALHVSNHNWEGMPFEDKEAFLKVNPWILSDYIALLYQGLIKIGDSTRLLIDEMFVDGFQLFVNPLILVNNITDVFISNSIVQNTKYISNPYNLNLTFSSQIIMITSSMQINANYISMDNCQITNNQCLICSDGMISILSNYLLIDKSTFQENIAQKGGAVYLLQSKDKFAKVIKEKQHQIIQSSLRQLSDINQEEYWQNQSAFNQNNYKRLLLEDGDKFYNATISNSIFKQNQAVDKGGSIYIDNAKTYVLNCSFVENSANKAGAIYYDILNEDSYYYNKLYVFKSEFIKNSAQTAACIFSSKGYPIQGIELNNQFKDNTATFFGQNVLIYPSEMQFNLNSTQFKKIVYIKDHISGNIKDELYLNFMVNEYEIYKISTETLQLKILPLNKDISDVTPTILQQTNGTFNLQKGLKIMGLLGKQFKLEFTSDQIKQPIYNMQTGLLEKINMDYKVEMVVKMRNACPLGYELKKSADGFDLCLECQIGRYSLVENKLCKKCNEEFICYLNVFQLPSGYWRQNQKTEEIFKCDSQRASCIGDKNRTEEDNVGRNDNNYYCLEGHVGAICGDCDIKGEVWGASYYSSSKYTCKKCETANSLLILIGTILFSTILACYLVKSNVEMVRLAAIYNYMRKLNFMVSINNDEQSITIKFLTNYLQIISAISTLGISVPSFLTSFVSIVSSPSESILASQDCFLITYFKDISLPYFYIRVLMANISILVQLGGFFLLYTLVEVVRKRRIITSSLFTGVFFMFFINQPAVIKQIMGVISCRQIGSDSYVQDAMSYKCDENHSRYSLYILFPILFIWTFFVPFCLLIFMILSKFNMWKFSMQVKLGFLYFEYKENRYYWEFVKTLQKTLMIITLSYFEVEIITKGTLIVIILLSYSYATLSMKPYKNNHLNKLDYTCSSICSMSISYGVLLSNNSDLTLQIIFLWFLITINSFMVIVFIRDILKSLLRTYREQMLIHLQWLYFKYPSLKKYIKISAITKKDIIKLWQKARVAVMSLKQEKQNAKQLIKNSKLKMKFNLFENELVYMRRLYEFNNYNVISKSKSFQISDEETMHKSSIISTPHLSNIHKIKEENEENDSIIIEKSRNNKITQQNFPNNQRSPKQ